MNISLSWLNHYLKTDLSPDELSVILTDIGLEVESLEKFESVKGGLEGLVVGEVLTREKHPDADRLSITTVNVGEAEALQIVCGAPNVAAGQKVIVALNGAKLYPAEGDPFVIKKSKIRGVESNGMICAEDEIGLGKSHDGIMVLREDAKVGTPAASYFNLENDLVYSIGLTPNRVDAASHYGVARDVHAALRSRGIHAELLFPEHHHFGKGNGSLSIHVKVEAQEACRRYAGLCLTGIKVAPSPEWLQNKLKAIGLRPINNVVDITNFVLHELGHPLHAFDADKIKGKTIIVKKSLAGKKFVSLDEQERTLHDFDTMICNSEEEMCIAGVFGGLHSGVNDATQNIFLESAWFHPSHVRKTAKSHGINTDSSFRFERGADPEMVIPALKRAASLMVEYCGAQIASDLVDVYPQPILAHEVEYDLDAADRLIGMAIPEEKTASILKYLDITIGEKRGRVWSLSVPAFRVDVQRQADVVEEILRIYGYNEIPLPARMSASLNHVAGVDKDSMRHAVSDLLVANGFYEIMSNSLTKSDYVQIASNDQMRDEWNVRLLNPLSSELDVMRQTMLFGGLESILHNVNRQHSDLKLIEFGKVYFKRNDKYEENYRLAIFLSGKKEEERWNSSKDAVSFYTIKATVQLVFEKLGLFSALRYTALSGGVLEDGLNIEIAKKKVGEMGWVRSDILKKCDIKQAVFYADIDWDMVMSLMHMNKVKYKEISRFPSVRRDLSLLLNKEVRFADIEQLALQTERKLLREVGLFDVYEGKNLAEGKKSYAVHFILQDEEQTLTDTVIEKTMEKIRKTLEEKLGAELRS
ncbi:MAG: phenylalanine--tRNA ligase subunit beta [Flavobacteriales bacterium]|nr:phenylalanine--tRNA ligase subunit beta [Flavobacteriales bacterium]